MSQIVSIDPSLEQVMQPVETAHGLSNAHYTDETAFQMERKALFQDGWAAIGFASQVPNPGDVKPVDFLGMPLLMARDRDGALHVFQNVCRHRGMILVSEPKNVTGALRCPYHSWCYDLKGKLRATPHVGGAGVSHHEAIDPEKTGLIEVPHGVFLDAVFVNVSGTAEPFDTWIAPIASRWSEFADRPLFHGEGSSFTLDVNCNWKLAVENYCESYHLPWVHPALNAYSRLEDHYNISEARKFSGQGTLVYNPDLGGGETVFPNFEDLSNKWDQAAEYLAIYPNVLFGVHRDHTFLILLEPIAHNQTREHVEIFYTTQEAATSDAFADLRAKNAAQWKTVFIEDISVVEGMQKGRGAPGFDGGVFSPAMDQPTHAFHDWVASRLSAAS